MPPSPPPRGTVRRPRRASLRVEELEPRALLSAADPGPWVTTQAVANDTYYAGGSLWGMHGDALQPHANAYGSQADEAWAAGYTGSRKVYVAVLDEGIDYNHPDLKANVWANPYDKADGRDNDRNGYVDDVRGWDFYHGDNSVFDGRRGDATTDAHGTHVAGIIGASGGNGKGVAGVNWEVGIIPVKFLGPDGGWISDAVKGINYVIDLKKRHGLNVVAINASWGGGGYDHALHKAIINAGKAGILFVAAAGNESSNNDATAAYPANYSTNSALRYETVISVTALNKWGYRPSWANYGSRTVDLAAPGDGVVSTGPNGTYLNYSGTSMAAPHVTGAAALFAAAYLEEYGALPTAQSVRTAIINAAKATKTGSLAGKVYSGGRLNVDAAMDRLASGVAATATGGGAAATSSGAAQSAAAGTRIHEVGSPPSAALPYTSQQSVNRGEAMAATPSPEPGNSFIIQAGSRAAPEAFPVAPVALTRDPASVCADARPTALVAADNRGFAEAMLAGPPAELGPPHHPAFSQAEGREDSAITAREAGAAVSGRPVSAGVWGEGDVQARLLAAGAAELVLPPEGAGVSLDALAALAGIILAAGACPTATPAGQNRAAVNKDQPEKKRDDS
jgi:subtilisin family serine protease